jgi:hypothetical protein
MLQNKDQSLAADLVRGRNQSQIEPATFESAATQSAEMPGKQITAR